MLKVAEKTCHFGKFSNNLDKHGKDKVVTSFDIPFTLELRAPEVNMLAQDKTFHRRLYQEGGKGKPVAAADGFQHFQPLVFCEEFDEAQIEITLGKTDLSYEKCRIKGIKLSLCLNGITECVGSMHVTPKTDKEILLLLHYQNSEVLISIASGKASVSKRQQELPLSAEKSAGDKGEADDAENDDAESEDEAEDDSPGEAPPLASNVMPIRPME